MTESGYVPGTELVFSKRDRRCSNPDVQYLLPNYDTNTKYHTLTFHLVYERTNFITTQN